MGQSQLIDAKLRSDFDNVLRPMPILRWRQNSLGRVTPVSLSVNVSSVLLPSSTFSIFFRTSWSIACRITHQHTPSCNGMERNTNCHCHTLHMYCKWVSLTPSPHSPSPFPSAPTQFMSNSDWYRWLVHPKPHCTCAHTVLLVGGWCNDTQSVWLDWTTRTISATHPLEPTPD